MPRPRTSSPSARPCRSRGAPRWACRSACARTSGSRLTRGRFDLVHGFEPGLPSHLLPGAARDGRADGCDVLLDRPPRLSAGPVAAREAARADRRTARPLGADPRGGRGAVPRRLRARSRRASRSTCSSPGRSATGSRSSCARTSAPGRAASCARFASCPTGRRCCCGRRRSSRVPRSRATSRAGSRCGRHATVPRARPCWPEPRSSSPVSRGCHACSSRRRPRAARSPRRPASTSSRSSRRRPRPGSPRTATCAHASRRRRARSPPASRSTPSRRSSTSSTAG